jgi:hypothetical protein
MDWEYNLEKYICWWGSFVLLDLALQNIKDLHFVAVKYIVDQVTKWSFLYTGSNIWLNLPYQPTVTDRILLYKRTLCLYV